MTEYLLEYTEISLFCIAVLAIMLWTLRTSLNRLANQTILTHVFVMIIVLFALDLVSEHVEGIASPAAVAVNHAVSGFT